MKIITSRVSVYEVELDLKNWDPIDTKQIPHLDEILAKTFPSINRHPCIAGEAGGFLTEVKSGTNFAHVIEHIIIELLHLLEPSKNIRSGWTRQLDANRYVIHYSAPDFLTGRLAAILGVQFVKMMIKEEAFNLDYYINLLKEPMQYFTRDQKEQIILSDFSEPVSYSTESAVTPQPLLREKKNLTRHQRKNIQEIVKHIGRHLPFIYDAWRKSFLLYSGNFGKDIIDKIELINLDQFVNILSSGDFAGFYRGVRNLTQLIYSYRIPANFLVRSLWLYKNKVLKFIIEEYEVDKSFLHRAINDFEDLYQIIYHQTEMGFSNHHASKGFEQLIELKEFRELQQGKGCVLIVDDDEIARQASRDILEYHGYQTILARDGLEALEILINKGNEIGMVVLDLYMPKMNGLEVYSRMRSILPDIRALISSGYPIDNGMHSILKRDKVAFISKPFDVKKFLETVKSVMQ
jgi:CheY-like chemotaxis protein